MRAVLFAAAAMLSLSGCINTAPSETQLKQNADRCAGFGYKPGSKDYSDCQLVLAQQTAELNERRRAGAQAVFRSMSAASAASRPRETTCTQAFGNINCTTY